MVREHDGLGALQVRVAGQRRVDGLGSPRDEGLLRAAEPLADARDAIFEIETLVQGDLIVARATRVELAADLTDQLLEAALHVHVDVFELRAERERAGGELPPHRLESPHDRVALGRGEEPARQSAFAHATLPVMS